MSFNIKSKTLIANWVEERQVAYLEEGKRREDGTLNPQLHRSGHKGILSPSPSSPLDCNTMVQQSYKPPSSITITPPTMGRRQQQLLTQLYDMVSSQVYDEFNPPPPQPEYKSVTHKDFNKDFSPTALTPTTSHDVYSEAPASYWASNISSVTGVTQVKLKTAPFHKNTAFSTPIEEYLDQPKPHGID